MTRHRLAWLLLPLVAAGCAHASSAARDTNTAAMDALRSAYVKAFNAQDEPGLAALYAPAATIYSFTGQSDTGGAVIASNMVRLAAAAELRLKSNSAAASGPLMVEAGEWEHFDRASKALRASGFYSWTWRRSSSGAWQIDHQIVTMRPR